MFVISTLPVLVAYMVPVMLVLIGLVDYRRKRRAEGSR